MTLVCLAGLYYSSATMKVPLLLSCTCLPQAWSRYQKRISWVKALVHLQPHRALLNGSSALFHTCSWELTLYVTHHCATWEYLQVWWVWKRTPLFHLSCFDNKWVWVCLKQLFEFSHLGTQLFISMLWPVFCWVVYVSIYSLIRKSWIWIFVGYTYGRYHFQLVAYLLTSFVTSFNNQMFSTLMQSYLSLTMPCAFLILLLEILAYPVLIRVCFGT